jgi:hypothetical protein
MATWIPPLLPRDAQKEGGGVAPPDPSRPGLSSSIHTAQPLLRGAGSRPALAFKAPKLNWIQMLPRNLIFTKCSGAGRGWQLEGGKPFLLQEGGRPQPPAPPRTCRGQGLGSQLAPAVQRYRYGVSWLASCRDLLRFMKMSGRDDRLEPICNPDYSGGRDQEDCHLKPAQANSL